MCIRDSHRCFESLFALRRAWAVRAAGCLLMIGDLAPLKADVACCLFASCRFNRSSPSSFDDYFGQGRVVLILTLAPPALVTHGMSRVSAVLVDAHFQTVQNKESYFHDTMAKPRCWHHTTHGRRHDVAKLFATHHRCVHLSRWQVRPVHRQVPAGSNRRRRAIVSTPHD